MTDEPKLHVWKATDRIESAETYLQDYPMTGDDWHDGMNEAIYRAIQNGTMLYLGNGQLRAVGEGIATNEWLGRRTPTIQ